MRVCVCLGGEGSERIWNKCEKGKGTESERHLSASVTNNPSPFVQCFIKLVYVVMFFVLGIIW